MDSSLAADSVLSGGGSLDHSGLFRLHSTENPLTKSFGPFREAHFRDVILLDKCRDNVSELDSFWLSSSLFQGVFAVVYSQRLGYRVT